MITGKKSGQPSVVLIGEMQQRYHLRVITSPLYHKITKLESVKEFMVVWFQCLRFTSCPLIDPRCPLLINDTISLDHRQAFKEGKLLFWNLDENSFMFQREEPIAGATKTVVKGVLNDWDMVSYSLDESQTFAPHSTAQQHCTGTLPFMALDHSSQTPSSHYYRHDLESFFYLLLWAAIRYDLKGQKKKELPRVCQVWAGRSLQDVLGFKAGLEVSRSMKEAVLATIPVEWSRAKRAWIIPLIDLFTNARRSEPRNYGPISEAANESSRDDENTASPFPPPAAGTQIPESFMWPDSSDSDEFDRVYEFNDDRVVDASVTDNANYDYSTYGGRLTYKTFMEAIGQSGEDPTK
jgi:Fungal protein kinase